MRKLFPNMETPRGGARKASGEQQGLRCAEPGCGAQLALRWSNKTNCWFYGCERWPDCQGVLPANKDGSPRGRPRTREVQGWRNKAHQAFDPLWKGDGAPLSRGAAYAWLRAAGGFGAREAHMFQMGIEQCQAVIRLVQEKGPGTEFWTEWRKTKPSSSKRSRRGQGSRSRTSTSSSSSRSTKR